jgi:hypothetical protein
VRRATVDEDLTSLVEDQATTMRDASLLDEVLFRLRQVAAAADDLQHVEANDEHGEERADEGREHRHAARREGGLQ